MEKHTGDSKILRDKKHIFFDFDGTLVDSLNDVSTSINNSLIELGFEELSPTVIQSLVGPDLRDTLTTAVNHRSFDFDTFIPVYVEDYYHNCVKTTVLYDDVINILQVLKERKKTLYILTNKPVKQTTQIARSLKIVDYFEEIIGPDTYDKAKPDPIGIISTQKKCGLHAKDMVMIGDTEIDILTAKNANIDSVAVSYGYREKEVLNEYSPTFMINKLKELIL